MWIRLGFLVIVGVSLIGAGPEPAWPQPLRPTSVIDRSKGSPADVLTADEWQRVDRAVARALEWLAREQQRDGSFPTIPNGQPGVTSLCTMAFVAHGSLPGEGRYGQQLERATDFVLGCQKQNGLVALVGPDGPTVDRNLPDHEIGICAAYNHAISSLMLSEMYGMSPAERAKRIEAAIVRSLALSLAMQRWEKDRAGRSWRLAIYRRQRRH